MTSATTVQATFAATLVDEWIRAGVTDAVVAPGSRSTPMALALLAASEAGLLALHIHLDERSAAFFALGLGLASGRPAVVLTTSGTAAAELLPAVVEAHHARVPMIVCTADRPPELHAVSAPQAIAQDALFGGGVLRWQCDPGPAEMLPPLTWRSLGARVVSACLAEPLGPGPVQFNLSFRDPLVGVAGLLPEGREGRAPWHRVVSPMPVPSELDGGVVVGLVSGCRGVLVAGAGCGDPALVVALADQLEWPVLADALSGCRGRGATSVVCAFDTILRSSHWAASHQPEVVLRVGALPASKVLASWLAASAAEQIVADPHASWPDPERTASILVRSRGDLLCRSLAESAPSPAPQGWAESWVAAQAAAEGAIDRSILRHTAPTEPGVARAVTKVLGPEATLVVSSSMPVRDVEWFGHPSSSARVLANRGANGIDGVVSTALGVAAHSRGPTVALLGDLAFLHDAGGLLWATRRGLQLTFVVVDNDGGGIFSFLPQKDVLSTEQFERLFGTPHGVDLAALAGIHGLAVTQVADHAELGPSVLRAVAAGGVRLVLVHTDRSANLAVHAELNADVEAALASEPGRKDLARPSDSP